jgi:hypothetical protein
MQSDKPRVADDDDSAAPSAAARWGRISLGTYPGVVGGEPPERLPSQMNPAEREAQRLKGFVGGALHTKPEDSAARLQRSLALAAASRHGVRLARLSLDDFVKDIREATAWLRKWYAAGAGPSEDASLATSSAIAAAGPLDLAAPAQLHAARADIARQRAASGVILERLSWQSEEFNTGPARADLRAHSREVESNHPARERLRG